MEKERRTKLSAGTWVGIAALGVAIIGVPALEVGAVRDEVRTLCAKIDTFQAEMRDIHGRVSFLEAKVDGC